MNVINKLIVAPLEKSVEQLQDTYLLVICMILQFISYQIIKTESEMHS